MTPEHSVSTAPLLVLRPQSLTLPRAETPTAWTGLEKSLQRPLEEIRRGASEPTDWNTDGLTQVSSPTASLLMLARPPLPELEPVAPEAAARERDEETSPKHSTLRPPAPPPDAAVTEVRLPPHPAPSSRCFDHLPLEDSEPSDISEGQPAKRTTRPGFAFDREEDHTETDETLEESGLHTRPWSAAVQERERTSRERSAHDGAGMPGWMRRRRAEERRVREDLSADLLFSRMDEDEGALEPRASDETTLRREGRPSRAELEAAASRRRLAFRVGLLVGAFVLSLGAMLALVL